MAAKTAKDIYLNVYKTVLHWKMHSILQVH